MYLVTLHHCQWPHSSEQYTQYAPVKTKPIYLFLPNLASKMFYNCVYWPCFPNGCNINCCITSVNVIAVMNCTVA